MNTTPQDPLEAIAAKVADYIWITRNFSTVSKDQVKNSILAAISEACAAKDQQLAEMVSKSVVVDDLLSEQIKQLAQLTKELAEAKKDTARLDWLETYSFRKDHEIRNMREVLDWEIAKHARQALSSAASTP